MDISNVTFRLNTAEYNGGAIDCNGSRMNLTDTVFNSNYAQYGAALCREEFATAGFGYNNSFISNHAYKSGAALGWMKSASISIDKYYFYNNTADVSGGAIYVGAGSNNCTIRNSIFEENHVTGTASGRGGVVDMLRQT